MLFAFCSPCFLIQEFFTISFAISCARFSGAVCCLYFWFIFLAFGRGLFLSASGAAFCFFALCFLPFVSGLLLLLRPLFAASFGPFVFSAFSASFCSLCLRLLLSCPCLLLFCGLFSAFCLLLSAFFGLLLWPLVAASFGAFVFDFFWCFLPLFTAFFSAFFRLFPAFVCGFFSGLCFCFLGVFCRCLLFFLGLFSAFCFFGLFWRLFAAFFSAFCLRFFGFFRFRFFGFSVFCFFLGLFGLCFFFVFFFGFFRTFVCFAFSAFSVCWPWVYR